MFSYISRRVPKSLPEPFRGCAHQVVHFHGAVAVEVAGPLGAYFEPIIRLVGIIWERYESVIIQIRDEGPVMGGFACLGVAAEKTEINAQVC